MESFFIKEYVVGNLIYQTVELGGVCIQRNRGDTIEGILTTKFRYGGLFDKNALLTLFTCH